MKMFLAVLTTTLLLMAAFSNVNAQESGETPKQQMPMMGGQQGMMGGGMMSQTEGGMRCPMCGQMMGQMPMMGKQSGMMSGMPMMADMMKQMMGGQHGMMQNANLPDAQVLLVATDELRLTDTQIQSLKDIFLRSQKESIKKHADLAIAQLELNALLEREQIETKEVQQKLNQVASLEAELKMTQIQASIGSKAVLTAEQRDLFKDSAKKGKMSMMQKDEKTEKSTEHEKHH